MVRLPKGSKPPEDEALGRQVGVPFQAVDGSSPNYRRLARARYRRMESMGPRFDLVGSCLRAQWLFLSITAAAGFTLISFPRPGWPRLMERSPCVFSRTSRKSRPHIAAKTARVEPKNESEQAAAPEEKPVGAEEGRGPKREEDSSNEGKLSAEGKSTARKAKEPKRAATAAGLPSSSTLSSSPRSSSGRQQTPPLSRMAEAPGLTPSEEMRLLQEARDSPRAAVEASGCGRRARAPSRKFLEASGKIVGESAQWMTREKKEEQARLSLKLKEQRKAAAAAGLKPGEVIEAATAAGAGGDDSRGENAPSNGSWRKLTPAEILRAAGKAAGVGKAKKSLPGSTETKRATTEKQREGPATEAETGRRSAKRRCSSASEVASESKRGRHPKGKAPGGGSWRGAAGSKD